MGLSVFVLMMILLGTCVDAQSVKMTWCYSVSAANCAGYCVAWTAQDNVCYAGQAGAPAGRVKVDTSTSPPVRATLTYYQAQDCSGSGSQPVDLLLDGMCHNASTNDTYRASNNAAPSLGMMTGVIAAVGASLWSVLQ
jgi:hypothetical protein